MPWSLFGLILLQVVLAWVILTLLLSFTVSMVRSISLSPLRPRKSVQEKWGTTMPEAKRPSVAEGQSLALGDLSPGESRSVRITYPNEP